MVLFYLRNKQPFKISCENSYVVSSHSTSLTYGASGRSRLQNNGLQHEWRFSRGASQRHSAEVFPRNLDLGHGATGVSWMLPGAQRRWGCESSSGTSVSSIHDPSSSDSLISQQTLFSPSRGSQFTEVTGNWKLSSSPRGWGVE